MDMNRDEKDMRCGCGKQGRYIDRESGEMSCNKYKRCPTYDELVESHNDLMNDFKELFRAGSALACYKEGSEFYKEAEFVIKRIGEKYYFR